jgi:hypothetical protein
VVVHPDIINSVDTAQLNKVTAWHGLMQGDA